MLSDIRQFCLGPGSPLPPEEFLWLKMNEHRLRFASHPHNSLRELTAGLWNGRFATGKGLGIEWKYESNLAAALKCL